MKRILLALLAILCFPVFAHAQVYPPVPNVGLAANLPHTCTMGAPLNPTQPQWYFATDTSTLYVCISNTASYPSNWGSISGSSGSVCAPSGSAGDVLLDSGSGTCNSSADFVQTSHTLAGGSLGILDMHSASSEKLPGSLSTGLVRVTTGTGAIGSGELSGDATTSGSNAVTVVKINGTAFAGTSTHLVAFGAANIPVDSGIPDTAAGILAACTGCAPLVSPSFTTPALGAATANSLLASGIVDGTAPVTATTGSSATLGAGMYQSGYTMNQEATAGAAVTYTLPATVKGAQYCVQNSIVSGTGAPDTGVLTVYPPASSYVILAGVINTIGGGGTHGVASGGAAADAACFVAIDSTHWTVYPSQGTWTEN